MLYVLIKLQNELHKANCKKEIAQNIIFITNRTNHNTKTSCYASVTKHLGIGMSVRPSVRLSVGLFRHNFQKSLNNVMQGLYCTVCVNWSGPWYSTCVHTAAGRTQSGIEQEYLHER